MTRNQAPPRRHRLRAAVVGIVVVTGSIATVALNPTATTSPAPAATLSPAPQTAGSLPPGVVLPDSTRTPGATNPNVTQTNIGQTICVTGWTATIRPPSSVTTAIKRQQLATGYTYQNEKATSAYEEDHLISLELGGAPSSVANLWPEPYKAIGGARVKDTIENKLHQLVCAGTLTLAAAQTAIAHNWWIVYETYVGGQPSAPASR